MEHIYAAADMLSDQQQSLMEQIIRGDRLDSKQRVNCQ